MNWDFDNRLNTADVGNNGSVDVTYKFDAMGRRVFRTDGTGSTVFVQAGQQTIADYTAGASASSPVYRYVYASYIDEPVLRVKPSASESLYYHRNQQYSVVALTNASAAIVERWLEKATVRMELGIGPDVQVSLLEIIICRDSFSPRTVCHRLKKTPNGIGDSPIRIVRVFLGIVVLALARLVLWRKARNENTMCCNVVRTPENI